VGRAKRGTRGVSFFLWRGGGCHAPLETSFVGQFLKYCRRVAYKVAYLIRDLRPEFSQKACLDRAALDGNNRCLDCDSILYDHDLRGCKGKLSECELHYSYKHMECVFFDSYWSEFCG
jgi:hypothetical protein